MSSIAPDPAPALSRRRELGSSSARSLLFTVLGEYVRPAGEPVWTGALVRVLGQLGVAEKAARQALARTAAEGWITGRRHGRQVQWELTEAGSRLLTDGAGRIYSFGLDGADWDGRWLVLLAGVPEGGRDLRHQLRTRLTWAGFGALPGGVWVSPDTSREDEAAAILRDLGLDAGAMSFVAHHGGIGAQAGIAARAWDLSAVEIAYKEFTDTVEAMAPVTDEDVLTAQTLLVHEWRRFPFLDPRLPRDLLPAGWLGAQAAALFQARHAQWRDGAQRHWAVLARY
ncbi:MAG TPA: PaaX family transcriptional regulator C-terminal domain-containing protein [Streptosporangiaceae bacterium]